MTNNITNNEDKDMGLCLSFVFVVGVIEVIGFLYWLFHWTINYRLE